jgi:mono/diheme cytochrome c family protein
VAEVIRAGFLLGVLLLSPLAVADDHRAQVNYMIHCQGCHLPDAVGFDGRVPRMKDFAGYFLHSEEGREFLIRVPGVSSASLPDDEIAELINWLLITYSAAQLPTDFAPFTKTEVARLRSRPESDPEATRKIILDRIAADSPALARQMAVAID